MQYDVNRYPYLTVIVPTLTGGAGWALKVNDGTGEKVIQADHYATGSFTYHMPSLTGWGSSKKFDLILFQIGGPGTSMVVDEMRIASVS